MDDAMLLPASDSSLAWVYEGATPAMTPDDAATAIRAATIGWTQDDHLQMGALQHHLAVALCDDPERQAACSAAAYMHVAAAGLNPGSLLGKGMDPKVLRPKLGTKPERIGTTRSGKPIYNMFTHPAHASFKTADHVDHIKAMEAHSKGKKMNKAGGEGSRGGKVIGHTKTGGKPIYASKRVATDTNTEQTSQGRSTTRSGKQIDDHTHQKYRELNEEWSKRKDDDDSAGHVAMATAAAKLHPSWSPGDHDDAKSKFREGSSFDSGAHQAHHFAAQAGGAYGADGAAEHAKAASEHMVTQGKMKRAFTDKEARAIGREIFAHHKKNPGAPALGLDEAARRLSRARNLPTVKKSRNFAICRGSPKLMKSKAASILEDFLAKSSASVLGRTSSGKAVHPAGHPSYSKMHSLNTMASGPKKRVGMQDAIRSTLRAHGGYTAKDHSEAGALHEKAGNTHLAEMHNIASGFLETKNRARKSLAYEGHMHKSEAVSILENFLSKSGEGSRGGKVVAHTASGAPIYAAHSKTYRGMKDVPNIGSHNAGKEAYDERDRTHLANAEHVKAKYPKFTKEDHKSAAEFHEHDNNHHVAGAHHAAAGYFDQERFAHLHAKKSMSKSGEGSRGGKVVGHTRSGKPIYDHKMQEFANPGAREVPDFDSVTSANVQKVKSGHSQFSADDHHDAADHFRMLDQGTEKTRNIYMQAKAHRRAAYAAETNKSMLKSDIMGFPVDLGDMQGSPIDGSYVDSMGGSHDLFMQQAELANCPTMWAPIATVPEN